MTHKVGHDIVLEGINKGKIKMPPLPKVWRHTTPPSRKKIAEAKRSERNRKKTAEAKRAERKIWGGSN
jgi:hypothetical protein